MTYTLTRPALSVQFTPMNPAGILPVESKGMATLSAPLQELLTWIEGQGEVNLADIRKFTGETQASIASMLNSLQQEGLIETIDLAGVTCYRRIRLTTNQHLLLCPEEPSAMVVQLKNQGRRSLQLWLRIEGNFPWEWCDLRAENQVPVETPDPQSLACTLAAGQQLDITLTFRLPADFFERDETLPQQQDYACQVEVTTTEDETGHHHHESAAFQLHVRPHSLYLRFLPALYGEVDFVGRFLKIFEQTFEPAVWTMNTLWAYLDPLTAPRAILPFLAYWVGWVNDPHWNTERQRRLISNAMEIYRWRGTRKGLRLYLHLYTDLPLDEDLPEAEKHICIEELFSRSLVIGQAAIQENVLGRLGGGRPYHFVVRLRPDLEQTIDEPLVRRIIDQEKPAFCTYDLHIERPN